MLDLLVKLNPNLKELQESPILDVNGNEVAWHCTTILDGKQGFSGGFHKDRIIARKIALSEFIERTLVKQLAKQKQVDWHFDKVPTGCGFAVGFNRETTLFRSLCEAIERWALSKWVDENFDIPRVHAKLNSPSSRFFASNFDKVDYFLQKVPVKVDENKIVVISVGAVIGHINDGIFLGSRASLDIDDVWEHSLVEAYRHLLIVKNGTESSVFPFNRIFYFAKNKNETLKQINAAKKHSFPAPTIEFQRIERIPQDNSIFIARTILSGGIPWHLGPVSRFLY
ncbi:MAG: YcaO-like family protein [Bdellovibrio sp.]